MQQLVLNRKWAPSQLLNYDDKLKLTFYKNKEKEHLNLHVRSVELLCEIRNGAIPYWNVPYDMHNFATFSSLVTIHKKE